MSTIGIIIVIFLVLAFVGSGKKKKTGTTTRSAGDTPNEKQPSKLERILEIFDELHDQQSFDGHSREEVNVDREVVPPPIRKNKIVPQSINKRKKEIDKESSNILFESTNKEQGSVDFDLRKAVIYSEILTPKYLDDK